MKDIHAHQNNCSNLNTLLSHVCLICGFSIGIFGCSTSFCAHTQSQEYKEYSNAERHLLKTTSIVRADLLTINSLGFKQIKAAKQRYMFYRLSAIVMILIVGYIMTNVSIFFRDEDLTSGNLNPNSSFGADSSSPPRRPEPTQRRPEPTHFKVRYTNRHNSNCSCCNSFNPRSRRRI